VGDGVTNAKGVTRRRLLGGVGTTLAATAAGCTAPGRTRGPRYPRPLSRGRFVAPRVSADRVVRVITGLRPYRPTGFVVKRETYDDTNVVHNYGHGGGGISLAWGSSALALREAHGLPIDRAAVAGGGIMGLTTARLLQDAGWQVTIYTRNTLRHSVSSVAGGQWVPTSVFEEEHASDTFKAQFRAAARIAHHAYQNLGPGYGVSFIENYYLGDTPLEVPGYLRELPELFTSVAELEPHQHPFPQPYVRQIVTMLVEPAIFLRRVRDDFLRAGGRFVIRDFTSCEHLLTVDEPLIFNCTGLGARALFDDAELIPAKGQLVLLPPDPAVDFMTIGGGSGVSYMFPRAGEILLGGSFQRGDWSRQAEPEVTERILADHAALFAGMT
jgi:glycine/D-amino acid oxidase-like deaminating enzyme